MYHRADIVGDDKRPAMRGASVLGYIPPDHEGMRQCRLIARKFLTVHVPGRACVKTKIIAWHRCPRSQSRTLPNRQLDKLMFIKRAGRLPYVCLPGGSSTQSR